MAKPTDATPNAFIYLLNRMENAAQASDPSTAGYGMARRAVLEYVQKLESMPSEIAPTADAPFKYRMVLKFDGFERVVEGEYPASPVSATREISEVAVTRAAVVIAQSPLIDKPKLPGACWEGLARQILEAAYAE